MRKGKAIMNGKEKTASDYAYELGQIDPAYNNPCIIEALESFARQEVEKERAAIIAILDSKRFYLGGGEGELADAIRERS